MKKILALIIGVAAGATLTQAQGYLELYSPGQHVTTNTAANAAAYSGNPSSFVSGVTTGSSAAPFAYDYALLYIASGAAATPGDISNPTASDWSQLYVDVAGSDGAALLLTNFSAGGSIQGQGGSATSPQVLGANNAAFVNGTSYAIEIVGWSASLGSSWATVSTEYGAGFAGTPGFFGWTDATVNPNSGAPGVTPTAMFGNSSLVLYSVPVPEPTTLALAGLGGISMLFLRRRKA